MVLYPHQNLTFAFHVVFTFYVCCLRFDITGSQCDIALATLEFQDGTLKFDNKMLIFHETFQLHIFTFTATIRHAQLPFYATVPLKCKLPPSLETRLVSLRTHLVSFESFLASAPQVPVLSIVTHKANV